MLNYLRLQRFKIKGRCYYQLKRGIIMKQAIKEELKTSEKLAHNFIVGLWWGAILGITWGVCVILLI